MRCMRLMWLAGIANIVLVGTSFGIKISKFFHITEDNKLTCAIEGKGWKAQPMTMDDIEACAVMTESPAYMKYFSSDIWSPTVAQEDAILRGYIAEEKWKRKYPDGALTIASHNGKGKTVPVGFVVLGGSDKAGCSEYTLTIGPDYARSGIGTSVTKAVFKELAPEIRSIGRGQMLLPHAGGKVVPLKKSTGYFSCYDGKPLNTITITTDVMNASMQKILAKMGARAAKPTVLKPALVTKVTKTTPAALETMVQQDLIGKSRALGLQQDTIYPFIDYEGKQRALSLNRQPNRFKYHHTYDVTQHDGENVAFEYAATAAAPANGGKRPQPRRAQPRRAQRI